MELLQFLKEYWFLITLAVSILTAISYMVMFQVTPWEKYREISERNATVKMHIQLGQTLLDYGYYQDADSEFGDALSLLPGNPKALEGRRKTHLFLQLESPDWKPGRAVAYINVFKNPEDHNILLFMGMLHQKIGKYDKELDYFKKAESAFRQGCESPGGMYCDALYQLGWHFYWKGDYDPMADYFRNLQKSIPYDYRGYHGLGYALYMKAINVSLSRCESAVKLLDEAAELLSVASDYVPRILAVNMDLGEIVRIGNPNLSILFHEHAMECVKNDQLYSLQENNGPLGVSLILSMGSISLSMKEDKIAWINYQLALDYYVKAFLENMENPNFAQHDRCVSEAQAVQKGPNLQKIYQDQKLICDRLLKCKMEF